MMDDDGNVTDVGDFHPDYKRYIVSSLYGVVWLE